MINLAVGSAALSFGLYTIWIRSTRPEWFLRLGKMQERYGTRAGYWAHVVGYSLVPMAIGLYFLLGAFGVVSVGQPE